MTLFKLTTGAVLASMIAVTALAHGGATGIVKERMDGMSAMKDAMKTLTPMMQGKTPYDAGTVRDAAETIGRHAGDSMTRLFPEGSDGMPSEAKPAIWQDWDAFAELAEQLQTYAEGLALAADNGLMMAGAGQGSGLMGGSGMMGGASMMGGGAMTGGPPGREELSEMPADGVFMMLGQTCSACHTRFRSE
ncbi:c-type cytochrome [Ruegeria arenilitoris]|uniref:c-type cytochrome n=1 Tax=Ruegeria arenilitoris TaxID=1173585 RepID=UPI00147D59E1|nr:cytochrome c [Ruegeria arenilitoris]